MTRFIECEVCHRPIEDEGVPYCVSCEIFASDDDECGACGSVLGLDRSCTCDLNYSGGHAYWKRRDAA